MKQAAGQFRLNQNPLFATTYLEQLSARHFSAEFLKEIKVIQSTFGNKSDAKTDEKTVRMLSIAWIVLAVFSGLSRSSIFWVNQFWMWASIFVAVLGCWGVLERKRWARLTMIGCYSIIIADRVLAVLILYVAPPFLSFGHLGLFGAVNKVLVVSGLQSAFSAIVIVLAMISMSLLLRPTVREQFESRKPSHNRMFQFGIAFALCMVV